MDQVKVFLEYLRKYHFWVLCGVVFLVSIACWYVATGDLAGQTKAREAAIDGAFSKAAMQLAVETPPNDNFLTGMDKRIIEQTDEVWLSWWTLYNKQKKNVMKWPDGMAKEMKAELELLDPKAEIHGKICNAYRDYITRDEPGRLKKLLGLLEEEIVEVDPDEAALTVPQPGRDDQDGLEKDYFGRIYWPTFDEIFEVYDWNARPKTFQVRAAQEDIWVYSALFRALSQTNEGVEVYRKAKIKRILFLQIGQKVPPPHTPIMDWLKLETAKDSSALPTQIADRSKETAPTTEEEMIRHLRYVDLEGFPLRFDAEDPTPQFKLMPVAVVLMMDQRELPRLLTNCANSDLPIMVTFQVLPPTVMPNLTDSYGGGGFGGVNSRRNSGTRRDENDPNVLPEKRVVSTEWPDELVEEPHDANVVLRGYAVIYQQPDKSLFQGTLTLERPEISEDDEPAKAEDPKDGEPNAEGDPKDEEPNAEGDPKEGDPK
ncbi:MAG: hypothetical protein N2C14_07370, partial [Planctomycetales bacterium]